MLTLPQTAEYALRAVTVIAEAPDGAPMRVGDIAAALKAPRNYLSKTLYQLVGAGVLRSTRGPRGGFQLAKPPARLTLIEVVGPFLPAEGRPCVLGRASCSNVTPCAAHDRWKVVAERMRTFFGRTTIADLVPPRQRAARAAAPRRRVS